MRKFLQLMAAQNSTPQWMRDAVKQYGLDIEDIKAAYSIDEYIAEHIEPVEDNKTYRTSTGNYYWNGAASKAFDHDDSTTMMFQSSSEWNITFEYLHQCVCNRICFYVYTYYSATNNFVLYGSNDNSTWDTIHSYAGSNLTNGIKNYITFDNRKFYRYYKLHIDKFCDDTFCNAIKEIYLDLIPIN